jgi:hypothetical protein
MTRSIMALGLVALSGLRSLAAANAAQAWTIDADFPGGNIVVERIEGDEADLRPDLRDTEGWWFYWNFRVRGGQGRTLTFRFTGPNPIGVRGPARSTDQGLTWTWLGADCVEGASFRHAFGPDEKEVRFCFAMPYQESHLRDFLTTLRDDRLLAVEELCTTPAGRGVERLRVGDPHIEPRYRIFVTARHHACESLASYALEGLINAALGETDDGRWFRENVHLVAIPFVDKDGVEQGDQGKNRRPRDHNRDYGGESVHPSVAAIRGFVPEWSCGRLDVFLDLHCPSIRGPHSEVIYLVGNADPTMWRRQEAFGEALEAARRGRLPYRATDNLPFGTAWNTDRNYAQGISSARWAGELAGIGLATTIEIPYANAGGNTVDAVSARAFGHDLLRGLRAFLTAAGAEASGK